MILAGAGEGPGGWAVWRGRGGPVRRTDGPVTPVRGIVTPCYGLALVWWVTALTLGRAMLRYGFGVVVVGDGSYPPPLTAPSAGE